VATALPACAKQNAIHLPNGAIAVNALRPVIAFLGLLACSRADTPDRSDSAMPDSTVLIAMDSGAPKLEPRDEADASFREFRTRTLEALSRRDTTYLYGMLAPEIRNTFGDDDGIDGFRRVWNMNDATTSHVWAALTRVLNMGGQQPTDSNFTAPYVHAFWPDSMDAFGFVAVTMADARIHEAPGNGSTVKGAASYSILRFRNWHGLPESGVATDSSWAEVELPGGATGWMRGVDVYSPVSWRAMFVRRGERWVMIFFVAGD
jgi:hypothetical protein